MDPKAIIKAENRLRAARAAVARFSANPPYDEFCSDWYVFLVAAKNIYTALERGAKGHPKSRQYIGDQGRFRRNDPLLQYLFQARDDDEHGIEEVTELVPAAAAIIVGRDTISLRPATPADNLKPPYYATITSEDGEVTPYVAEIPPGSDFKILQTPAHPRLKTATGRGGITYDPPISHKGQPITDNSPLAVANLALAYLASLIAASKTL